MLNGAAVSGLNDTFQCLGGGALGFHCGGCDLGIAVIGCVAVSPLVYNRRQRRRFHFPVRPMWAEVLLGTVGCVTVLGVAAYMNANYWPKTLAANYAAEHNIPVPEGGLFISPGFPWPILLVIGVTIVMTFVANRRKSLRYVYAMGGNPEAAELGGMAGS